MGSASSRRGEVDRRPPRPRWDPTLGGERLPGVGREVGPDVGELRATRTFGARYGTPEAALAPMVSRACRTHARRRAPRSWNAASAVIRVTLAGRDGRAWLAASRPSSMRSAASLATTRGHDRYEHPRSRRRWCRSRRGGSRPAALLARACPAGLDAHREQHDHCDRPAQPERHHGTARETPLPRSAGAPRSRAG